MMTTTLILTSCWVFWCLIQFGFALYFLRIASAHREFESSGDVDLQDLPSGRAAVLLAVRGSDPSFADCIASLIQQSHDDFEIHVVVDSETDPAWDAIHRVQDQLPEGIALKAHLMTQPLKTCGLKCSSLIYGFEQIKSDPEYLVLVDSDVVVHRHWLRELIAPLRDERVGVVTGNQWFDPAESAGAASLVRSLWNAGAIVPTVMFRNPWAGSLAMRVHDVKRSELIETWKKSIVDDGPIRTAFEPLGLETRFVPSLVMVNRESCTGAYVLKYVRRMLTWSRMYEQTFINTVIHAAITSVLMLSVLAVGIAGALTASDWQISAIAGAALMIGAMLNAAGYMVVRLPIARTYRRRGQPLTSISLPRLLALVVLTPVTQLVYAWSVVRALTTRTVSWREARYQVNGSNECRLLEYKPFLAPETDSSII